MAISEVSKEILFAMSVLNFIGNKITALPITIMCDNTGAIFLSENQESRRTKYLDTKYHFIRDYVENGMVKITCISTDQNLADPFTKNLSAESLKEKFSYLQNDSMGGC